MTQVIILPGKKNTSLETRCAKRKETHALRQVKKRCLRKPSRRSVQARTLPPWPSSLVSESLGRMPRRPCKPERMLVNLDPRWPQRYLLRRDVPVHTSSLFCSQFALGGKRWFGRRLSPCQDFECVTPQERHRQERLLIYFKCPLSFSFIWKNK